LGFEFRAQQVAGAEEKRFNRTLAPISNIYSEHFTFYNAFSSQNRRRSRSQAFSMSVCAYTLFSISKILATFFPSISLHVYRWK
jgi:hypothetical protein